MMHQGVMSKGRANAFFPVWVRQRELRQRLPLGHSDAFYKRLYSSISPCHSWGRGESSVSQHGGLFSLEFSPDGSLLVAGCDSNSFQMFDPLSRRLIRTVHNAHASVVTNVKFLDSRIFATGGVDKTVSLWDTRNLKTRCQAMRGHSNTIRNIAFSQKNDLLITSGLDGYIYTWDMKNCIQREDVYKDTFRSHVLLRLRLTPDETKMIISTASGYLLIIHELDLNTFAQDLNELRLDVFVSSYSFQQASTTRSWNSTCILSPNRRRNRVEIVADFPNFGAFHVISALEIHPQGWSAFSRSEARGQEWICVHDIQDKETPEGVSAPREDMAHECPPFTHQDAGWARQHPPERINKERRSGRGDGGTSSLGGASAGYCTQSSNHYDSELPDGAISLDRGVCDRRSVSPADTAQTRSLSPGVSSVSPDPFELADLARALRVPERFPRLTHYIDEPLISDFYIESLSVSADGRLVCSPFGRGIRLLAFSPECSEQNVSCYGKSPRRLHELGTNISHNNSVLCTTFSPRHCLLVSGGLDGKLVWYQPVV